MIETESKADFVSIVAREISSGIDRALRYWLARIEMEVGDTSLTSSQRVLAVKDILQEYKRLSNSCASA
jgi:hypothetical protein